MPREPASTNDPSPPPQAAIHLPRLRHGLATDAGRRRATNEDAASADTRLGLFVVCDGIGGQAAGEVASQLTCRALGAALVRKIRRRNELNQRSLKQLMLTAATELSAEMHRLAASHTGLAGMGCTLVAVLIDGRSAFVIHAGDSRALLLRNGQLRRLTRDHTKMVPRRPSAGARTGSQRPRRTLLQFVGSQKPLEPDACVLALHPGDRLLLCTDGLHDPVGDDRIAAILRTVSDPGQASAELVAAANRAGGPDNVTTVVIDYAGARPLVATDRRARPRTAERPPGGATLRLHEALLALERPFASLAAQARASVENAPAALALHRASVDPAGEWQRAHRLRLEALNEPLERVTAGTVRLSPLLAGDDTAELYRRLWQQWLRLEARYRLAFAPETDRTDESSEPGEPGKPGEPHAPPRPDIDPAIAALICTTLHQNLQALRQLLLLLPHFLREPEPGK